MKTFIKGAVAVAAAMYITPKLPLPATLTATATSQTIAQAAVGGLALVLLNKFMA